MFTIFWFIDVTLTIYIYNNGKMDTVGLDVNFNFISILKNTPKKLIQPIICKYKIRTAFPLE